MHASDDSGELFGTETMAELCARQGRLEEARAIYRRLVARGPVDERHGRWAARLEALEAQSFAPAAAQVARTAPAAQRAQPPVARAAHALPLVVREPVRSGQIVYAEGNDLIVLGPVNPGAQLMADGNIHVYGTLRGRAVAGVRGARGARIFCQRLEAELVGIDAAYLAAEDLPADRLGKPAQIALDGTRCVVAPL
jgi:septum site-determining protein MinC